MDEGELLKHLPTWGFIVYYCVEKITAAIRDRKPPTIIVHTERDEDDNASKDK
jgi:hypothetical protein